LHARPDAALLSTLLGLPEEEASALLHSLSGLAALPGQSPAALVARGVSPRIAERLGALAVLAARLAEEALDLGAGLRDPGKVAAFLHLRYAGPEEVLGAVYLDARGLPIAHEAHFRGTGNRVQVEPSVILRAALTYHARGVLLFHNHPSAIPEPSGDDLVATRRFAEACDLVGIRFVDHLILGDAARFTSMREHLGSKGVW
jgi:DNA repair protein RadC